VGGVRANWHVAELDVATDDPFAVDVEEVGLPIRLDGERASLDRQLVDLIRAEGVLFEAGITCSIKDRSDTCCSACPLFKRDGRLAPLCDVGRRQEQVCTRLAVRRVGG
jgi:hypothetical protein